MFAATCLVDGGVLMATLRTAMRQRNAAGLDTPRLSRLADVLAHEHVLIIGVIFFAAVAIRLYHIDEPPFNFNAVRQYHSLVIARGYYLAQMDSVPEWQKSMASINKEKEGVWEPQINEFVVSSGYRVVGEHFWASQILSSMYWLIGGIFLYRLAQHLFGADSAVLATGFYLLVPFGVIASRSTQPDALMVMGVLVGVSASTRYYRRPSKLRLLIAAVVCAVAILTKFVGVFPILGAFIAGGIYINGPRRFLQDIRNSIFLIISIAPTVAFYGYGVVGGGSIGSVAHGDILPQLVLEPFFWQGWLQQITFVITWPVLLVGLGGVWLLRRGLGKAIVIGMWLGYLLFGLVFTDVVYTHDYWNLMVVPIAALSAGAVGATILNHLSAWSERWLSRAAFQSAVVLLVAVCLVKTAAWLAKPVPDQLVTTAEEIGEVLRHSSSLVVLSGDYGLPLEYHGWVSGMAWPLTSEFEWERLANVPTLSAAERFQAWFAKTSPEYFVVMDLDELDRQPDLKQFLYEHFPVKAQTAEYLVFDLKHS
jgi:Dolichyl-phosphate-mannose-protein mannosyltransferase